jgi:FkbM family methyltransferase
VLRQLLREIVPRPLRNAGRRPASTLAWAWQEAAYYLGWSSSVDVTPDWRVRCHPASRIAFESARGEPDFRAEIAGFVRACSPGMRLLDVGAHVGFFTLAALHYGGPDSRAIAVEPSASAMRILGANVRLSGAADRVTLVRAGLGATRGTMRVLTTGAGGLYQVIRPSAPRPDAVEVPAMRLDDLVADRAFAPTHVKIDVEGFETDVLEGGREYLARHRPVVFLELHGSLLRQAGGDPARTLALLGEYGYRAYESHGTAVSTREAAAAHLIRLVCRG